MKLKSLAALTLAAVLLLSACANSGGNASPTSSAPAETAAAETAPQATGTPSETADASTETTDGILSDFSAADLDGNAVDSGVFDGYKLTMVNIWATFCGPCIDEMPDLAEISEAYADQGVRIIGVPIDIVDSDYRVSESLRSEAEDIIAQTGADYLHLVPDASMSALLGAVYAVPTTVFVDENGVQVGETQIGAKKKSDWTALIDELLEEVA